MNKIMMMLAIVSTMAMAKTSGSVEAYSGLSYTIGDNNTQPQSNGGLKHTVQIVDSGIKTKINVKGTGLELGAKVENNNIVLPITDSSSLIPYGDIYLKYNTPESNKVNSYFKLGTELGSSYKGGILEGDISFKIKDNLRFGYNIYTEVPFEKPKQDASSSNGTKEYRDTVLTKHKIYLTDDKNIDGFVEVKHTYAKVKEKAEENRTLKYVAAGLKVKKMINKDLLVKGYFDFKYYLDNQNGISNDIDSDYRDIVSDKKRKLFFKSVDKGAPGRLEYNGQYQHSYDLGIKYKEFEGSIFLQHEGQNGESHTIEYGLGLGVKHKLKNTKLTIMGEGLVIGRYVKTITNRTTSPTLPMVTTTTPSTASQAQTNNPSNTFDSYIKGGLKYDLVETSKFKLTPAISVIGNFSGHKGSVTTNIYILPEIDMTYMPTKNFEIKGEIVAKNDFSKDMEYKGSNIESKLNIKYMW